MLSKNQKKHVVSLKQKKFRTEHNSFFIEGVKMVGELLQSDYNIKAIYATLEWKEENPTVDCIQVSEKELSQLSSLKTPNKVLAVVKQCKAELGNISSKLSIALDSVQDPGNLGNIIRTADWFGVETILCSRNSVDKFNPKVIQSTMGSFFRVNVVYVDLPDFFESNKELIVYGALLEGEDVYQKQLNDKGAVILLGNESKGISDRLIPYVSEKIKIPNFGKAESLNVASASAILCSECRRS